MRYLLLYCFTGATIALAGLIYIAKVVKVLVIGPIIKAQEEPMTLAEERASRIAKVTAQIEEIKAQPYSAARDRILETLNKSLAQLQNE
jgi:hypothetical protein